MADTNGDDALAQLQLLEQNRQQFLMQKHQLQLQLNEIDSALEQLKDAKESYKIIANVMVSAKPAELQKDLLQKKEVVELRIKTLEKQDTRFAEKAATLQKEALGKM